MPNKMPPTKSGGSATLALSILQEDIQSSEAKVRTGFLQCSIEEEDCLDDIEPNLINIALTESFSSHVSSDIRSLGDCLELTPDHHSVNDTVNNYFCNQRLQGEEELKNSSEPSSARVFLTSNMSVKAKPMSDNSFDDTVCVYESKSKLSLSMHDVSKIPSFPLVSKPSNFSTETIQSQSITTVGSLPKSKDSGFPRSISCFSLNSGKSYDHIQSKVKEHIKQAKAADKNKRKLTYESETHETTKCKVADTNCEECTSPQILVPLINKLKEELEEKDRMLLKLQENYDALLMKYAAAENRIDHLRVNSVGNSFDIALSDYKKPKASPNVLLLPNLYDLRNTNRLSNSQESLKEVKLANQCNLTPSITTKFVCTSTRTCESSEVKTQKRQVNHQLPFDYKPVITASKDQNLRYPLQQNCNMDSEYNQVDNVPNLITNLNYLESQSKMDTSGARGIPNEDGPNKLPAQALNCQLENPFVKVKRWQESLPSLHLIEPNIYDQFTCNETENDKFNQSQEARIDTPQYNLDGASITADNNLLKTPVYTRLTVKQFSTPTNTTECEMAAHANETLLIEPSQSQSTLNDTGADLVVLKDVSDLFFHSTKSKSIATNLNSMSPSVNSSSTYLGQCTENLSATNVNIPPYIDDNTCKESASISVQTDLNMTCNVAYPLTTLHIQNCNIPCTTKTNANITTHFDQPCHPTTRLSVHENCQLPCSCEEQSSVKNTGTSGPNLLQNTTKEIGTGKGNQVCHQVILAQQTDVPVMDHLQQKAFNNSCKLCNTEQTTKSVRCDCSEPVSKLDKGKSYSSSFEEKNRSLIQYLDEVNQCAQKLRGKSEAIMQVLSAQLKES